MSDLSSHPPFVVTGASGYVGSWVVWELLSRGATVRGTVRDPSRKDKCQHLLDMGEALPGRLELVAADLLQPGSFDACVAGAGAVIHTASPFIMGKLKDAHAQLITPAVEGTRNVLRSVNGVDSVTKVVVTSSVVSIYGDSKDMSDQGLDRFTEEHWNTTSSPSHQPYSFSKTEAEKAAWAMHDEQDRWAMATINPGFVLGPSKTPRTDSESIAFMKQLTSGQLKSGVPALCFGIVDVRDVAKAHVEAAIRPDAVGRFILVSGSKMFLEMARILRDELGESVPLPKKELPKFLFYLAGPALGFSWKFIGANTGYRIAFDNTRSREVLGIEYRAPEHTLTEHARQVLGQA